MSNCELIVNDRPYIRPDIDYGLALEHLWCFPGKAIFVTPRHMDNDTRQSGVILPDRFTSRQRLPIATCLQAHRDTGLLPGATYVVNQRFARRVKNIKFGKLEIPDELGEVWMFGVTSPNRGDAFIVQPHRYVYARIPERDPMLLIGRQTHEFPYWFGLSEVESHHYGAGAVFANVKGRLEVHGRVVLKLSDRRLQSESGLHLPNSLKARSDVSMVTSVSDRCKTAKAGMHVWYQRRALDGLGLADDDFGVIAEDGIYAAVNLTGLA